MKLTHRKLLEAGKRCPTERPAGSDLRTQYDRAIALARGCEAIGDRVEAERFYQQADHYRRLLSSQAA